MGESLSQEGPIGSCSVTETGATERLLYLGRPCRVLLSFNPPFSLIRLNLEGIRGRTIKRIKFWIERLIINLAKGTHFYVARFH